MVLCWSYLCRHNDYIRSRQYSRSLYREIVRKNPSMPLIQLLLDRLEHINVYHMNAYYPEALGRAKEDQETLLIAAAKYAPLAVFKAIVHHPDVDLNMPQQEYWPGCFIKLKNGDTALNIVIKLGKVDFLEVLLEDPRIIFNLEDTIELISMSDHSKRAEMMELLFKWQKASDPNHEPPPFKSFDCD